jgi:hypothetical protein
MATPSFAEKEVSVVRNTIRDGGRRLTISYRLRKEQNRGIIAMGWT